MYVLTDRWTDLVTKYTILPFCPDICCARLGAVRRSIQCPETALRGCTPVRRSDKRNGEKWSDKRGMRSEERSGVRREGVMRIQEEWREGVMRGEE
jgi:hypothetical protein